MLNTETFLYLLERDNVKLQKCNKIESVRVLECMMYDLPITVRYYRDIKNIHTPELIDIVINKENIEELLNRYDSKSIVKFRVPHIGVLIQSFVETKDTIGSSKLTTYGVESRKTRPLRITYASKRLQTLDKLLPKIKLDKPSYTIASYRKYVNSDRDNFETYEIFADDSKFQIDDESLAHLSRFMKLNKGIVHIEYHRYNSNLNSLYNVINLLDKLGF